MDGVQFQVNKFSDDSRGTFVKFFPLQPTGSLNLEFKEFFRTSTFRGGVRGFHLQVAEAANWRVIHALRGSIHDVLLDLRPNSDTYLKLEARTMDSSDASTLLVPPGVAHAFQALEDAEVLYATTSPYAPTLDKGVNARSTYPSWPLEILHMSERDMKLPSLEEWINERS